MSVFHNNALIGAGGGAEAVAAPGVRSLRFNTGDSAYLSRTPSSAGNRRTWTWAAWVKRNKIDTGSNQEHALFVTSDSNANSDYVTLYFNDSNYLRTTAFQSGSTQWSLKTAQVFRDVGAWMHIVWAVDLSQSTASDRVKLYLNGSQITDFDTETYPSTAFDTRMNSTNEHSIGRASLYDRWYASLQLADIYFVDGLQLTPTSFGSTDSNGVWQRGTYSGTFGTNGFHLLDFENEGTIGDDSSGNSNDFTANNLSDTAGVGNDVLLDFPVNGSESDTGAGGEVSGNYCCWNPLAKGSNMVLKNGNLDIDTTTGKSAVLGTIGMSSGKWYWETTINGSSDRTMVGIGKQGMDLSDAPGQGDALGWGYYADGGVKRNDGTSSSYGASFDSGGDVIGCAFDADNGTLTFYKNGASQGTAFTGLTDGPYFPATGDGSGVNNADSSVNFGQRVWAYSAPSNHKALCTTNLSTPTIADGSDHFDIALYNGNETARSITGLDFSPDLVWLKNRDRNAYNHYWVDIIRGSDKNLFSNLTEGEQDAARLSSFDSNGFGLTNHNGVNKTGDDYVAWCFDGGSSTASNTDGSITSSVRANQSAGFSIVTFSGNGSSSATVGHGLNAVPDLIIHKRRNSTASWQIKHSSLPSNHQLEFTTGGSGDVTGFSSGGLANLTSSSTFGFTSGTSGVNNVNASGGTYVCYCFTSVASYSAFGKYTGNGSTDGPFVYTGFRPRWIMIKRFTDGTENWRIVDTARDTYNLADAEIYANSANAELSSDLCDILSNGFKIRVSFSGSNTSSKEYLYVAFAENPFQANGGLAR